MTLLLMSFYWSAAIAESDIVVGSKGFTESVILGELARLQAPSGLAVRHRRELGGSRILFEALKRGEIDVYPEYTGTLSQELIANEPLANALDRLELAITPPLGFNNTYALGMRHDHAQALNIQTMGELKAYPQLRFGFSNEFMQRNDGWPGLAQRYGLFDHQAQGMDHDLAYRALQSDAIDVIDLYSTDAEIAHYGLTVLADDLGYFPEYQALFLYRRDLATRAPRYVARLHALAGTINGSQMAAMNAAAKIDRHPEAAVAAEFLGLEAEQERSRWQRLGRRSLEHLVLVGISLLAAIAVALPLGVLAYRHALLGKGLLSAAGILQTIPSLALFVFLIPWLGIGAAPAIVALFFYSLLPILRNTHAGLAAIPSHMRDSAMALGLQPGFYLRHIELPLARGAIMAGIKTAAVINVGTATLGALIGAGGYGQPILTGIRLDDSALILEGAIPAALMAVFFQLAFDRLEHAVTPRGLSSYHT